MNIIMGIIGFLFCYLYDFNQVKLHKQWLKGTFFIGSALICIATLAVFITSFTYFEISIRSLLFLLLAIIFLGLLIYTLFFALPFEETYAHQEVSKTYRYGVYALCRHPGFWCMFFLYLMLALSYQTAQLWWIFIVFNSMNFLYIVIQDQYSFPKLFIDYKDYQATVPFLLIKKKNVRICLRTLKKGDAHETRGETKEI